MNYSIIIPHHNTPDLLQRLLHSIPQRDDLEVIIVDDNSDDKIVDFENFPGVDRPNTKVIFDKKGGGGGYARNIGLSYAKGKWIIFADADDFFNYCFNSVLDDYVDSAADVIFCKNNSLNECFYTTSYRTINLNNFIDSFISGGKQDDINLRYVWGEPVCKIVRRNIIEDNNIRFEETAIHNDTRYSYLVGYYAKTICVDVRAIYCVMNRVGSVSKQISEEKKLDRIRVFSNAFVFFREHKLPITEQRHFKQLLECKKSNAKTYSLGLQIMVDSGITQKEINRNMRLTRLLMLKSSIVSLFDKVILQSHLIRKVALHIVMSDGNK